MKKPLPYILFGKARTLVKKAEREKKRLLFKTHNLHYKNKKFVVCEFNPTGQKKALVVHGWMSESTHMMMYIKFLCENDYNVFAIDFPAHGKSPGFTLSWQEAVHCLLVTQNQLGPFNTILGHSFGGGMAVNATGVMNLSDEFHDELYAENFVLLASALDITVPIRIFSNIARLNKNEVKVLNSLVEEDSKIDFEKMSSSYLLTKYPKNSKYLVIHGLNDSVVDINVSRKFSKDVSGTTLLEKEGMGHVDILHNETILDDLSHFLCLK